ncbi:hypothetical protein ACOMHN_042273 [Nucella lapillus]
MDSSWTKVRQMVANRVLTRHLDDLHEQQVAMEMAQDDHRQHVERELRMSRNRGGSLITSTDALGPATSRRQSLPVSSRLPASHAPPPSRHGQRHDGAGNSLLGTARPGSGSTHDVTNGIYEDPDLLELMADTLRSADSMEQQRPSLYLYASTGGAGKSSSGTGTSSRKDRPLAASTKSQRGKAVAEGSLRLERGETFVHTDQSQVLTFGGDSPPSTSSTADDAHTKGARTKRKRQKKGGVTTTEGHSVPGPRPGASGLDRPRRGSVTVDFYDEETGLMKEDGGFTPKELALPLNMLEEEDEEADNLGAEGKEEAASGGEEGAGVAGGDPWGQVKKCQYIRGYDPPHMRMPKDSVKFVFGDKGHT